MHFFKITPPESLKLYVRYFWVLESESAYQHHSMASGCPELIFHYATRFDEINQQGKKEASFIAGLHAASLNSRQFISNSGFGIFGAYLFPYAIKELFGISPIALINQMPDLATLLGNEGSNLEEKIIQAANNSDRFNIITTFLERRVLATRQLPSPVFHVIREMIKTGGAKKVQEVHTDAYLSLRQFERQFLLYTGMTPKTFTRISRFHQALEKYGQEYSLTQIAHHCGYYDQSHFIHDFKAFSGLPPKSFFSGKSVDNSWRNT